MSKKTLLFRLLGIMILSILIITAVSYAKQYYDQYPGSGFVPADESTSYVKTVTSTGNLVHDDTSDAYYICPVTFNVPDGSVHFIKSIGMRYKDNLTDGQIVVSLVRHNLYTGADHTVVIWGSSGPTASPSDQTASQGTMTGYKLVDTKKFSYWLLVQFQRDGAVNPSFSLQLYQVRIHYGT